MNITIVICMTCIVYSTINIHHTIQSYILAGLVVSGIFGPPHVRRVLPCSDTYHGLVLPEFSFPGLLDLHNRLSEYQPYPLTESLAGSP